jgi:ABC-type sugar transport system ATPase subunit
MLSGAEVPDTGTVRIDGAELTQSGSARAQESFAKGVRVVYQELSLVPGMTLAENLFLGRWPRKGGILSYLEMEAQAQDAMARLGLDLSPSRLVAGLSPAERQLLEIARVLLGRPKLVILDEPTSSLAAAEAGKGDDRRQAHRQRRYRSHLCQPSDERDPPDFAIGNRDARRPDHRYG